MALPYGTGIRVPTMKPIDESIRTRHPVCLVVIGLANGIKSLPLACIGSQQALHTVQCSSYPLGASLYTPS